jgi:multidrug efflux pump subunit AcrB
VNVAGFAGRNSRVILRDVVLLSAAGLHSLATMPSNIYPEVEFPRIQIVAHAGDLSPRMMQLAVTRPLEEAARTVLGARRVRSKTIRGGAEISVIFNPDADMRYSLQLMQGKADEVRGELPAGTTLVVERMTPSLFPIFSVNVTGGLPPADLRDLAVYQLRPLLSRVPGVADVEVLASEEREISVIVDPDRLNAAKLTLEQVSDALKATNQVVLGRPAARDYRQYQVPTTAELRASRTCAGRGGVPAGNAALPGRPRRGARRRDRPHDAHQRNGQPAALLNVARQIRGNIRKSRTGLGGAWEVPAALPPSVKLQIVYDLAEFVRSAVASVRDAILIGGLLAVLVLVAFLRDWRVTAIAAVSLPLTLVGTFFVLQLVGGTINLMSLGGLAIAIGLVIDDAIVVVENIHRHRALGEPVAVAAEKGTQELLAAVVGSTLTTVVVFVPLGLLQGVVGQFFAALSLTLAAAVLLSLGYALFFIPNAAAPLLEGRSEPAVASRGGSPSATARSCASLECPRRVAIVTFPCRRALGAVFYFRLETGFLPEMDEGGYVIDYWTPEGTAARRDRPHGPPDGGGGRGDTGGAGFARRTGAELGLFATEQNRGDIVVKLRPRRAQAGPRR